MDATALSAEHHEERLAARLREHEAEVGYQRAPIGVLLTVGLQPTNGQVCEGRTSP